LFLLRSQLTTTTVIPLVEVALAVIAAIVVTHTGHIASSDRSNAGDGNRKSYKFGAIPIAVITAASYHVF
jgi:hypothetical protein